MIVCVDFDNILNNLTEKTIELYNSNNNKKKRSVAHSVFFVYTIHQRKI